MTMWETVTLVVLVALVYPSLLVALGAMLGPASRPWGEHDLKGGDHDHE